MMLPMDDDKVFDIVVIGRTMRYFKVFFFYKNRLKIKTNYHDRLVNKIFIKMSNF